MNPERFKKITNLLGEGFFADRVVSENDRIAVMKYGHSILEARIALNSTKLNLRTLLSLRKYIRFRKWIRETYGEKKFKNVEEAEAFVEEKIKDLIEFREGWKDFFKWLQKKTLDETSGLIYL